MKSYMGGLCVGIALAAGAVVAAARADDAPEFKAAPLGKAESAKACVESIISYAKKDDPESMCAYMVEPYRTSMPKMVKAALAAETANNKLVKAVDAKFGPGAAKELNLNQQKRPKLMEGKVEILEVKEEGEKATVKTRETKEGAAQPKEDTIICRKTEGFWFAEPPQPPQGRRPPNQSPENDARMMEAMAGALTVGAADTEALAADIESGKVATKEDAKAKCGELQMKFMQRMMGAMMPPGGMPPGGGPGGPGRGPGGPPGGGPGGPPPGGAKPGEQPKPPEPPPAPPKPGGEKKSDG